MKLENDSQPLPGGSSTPIKVSVITVSFNSGRTIHSTIKSVNQQSFSNIEHIFIDGGSSDRTLDIIEEYRGTNSLVSSERDEGVYDALNKGIQHASGEVVGFLHSDDFFADSWVVEAIASSFMDSRVQGVYGDLQYVSKSDPSRVLRNWKTKPFSRQRLRRGWMAPHPTLYIRKRWFELLGGFDSGYRVSGDYRFMLALFSDPNFKSAYLPEVLVKMRVGGVSNNSIRSLMLKSMEDLRALKQSGVGGLPTLVAKNVRKFPQFF
ncbi:glycosyltransferase [Luminiphilus sp.]|nr:glycosyltransferase [Luminiphilus sp.]